MITAFEVGSIFRIVDQASPALRAILTQVRAPVRKPMPGYGSYARPA
jgi:hypothetical protein